MRETGMEDRPSPRAMSYDVGRTIHLLPLEPALTGPVRLRLKAACRGRLERETAEFGGDPVTDPQVDAFLTDCFASLCAFAAWDSASISWDLPDLDPDRVLMLKGDDLMDAAATCRAALLLPSVVRLGIEPGWVIVAGMRAAVGLKGAKDAPAEEDTVKDAPPGEAAPAAA